MLCGGSESPELLELPRQVHAVSTSFLHQHIIVLTNTFSTRCAYAVGEAAALAAKTISTGLLTFKASREPDLTAVRKLLMGDNKGEIIQV